MTTKSPDKFYKLHMEVFAFDDEEQAKAFMDILMDAFMDIPEAAEYGAACWIIESDD